MNLLGEIKKIVSYVDSLRNVVVAATTSIGSIAAYGVTSRTLASFIACGILMGSVTGYYLTASRWHGRERLECLRQGRRNIVRVVILLMLFALILAMLQPGLASRFDITRATRELLLDAMVLTNIFIAVLAGYVAHTLVGAIVLHSPKLCSSTD